MNISFRRLNNNDFSKIHKWCSKKFVYEWFEQRILSYDEIVNKYTNKLNSGKQDLFIIQCDNIDVGLTQIYKFENDINLDIKKYKKIYKN